MPNDKDREDVLESLDFIKSKISKDVPADPEDIRIITLEALAILEIFNKWRLNPCIKGPQVNWLEGYEIDLRTIDPAWRPLYLDWAERPYLETYLSNLDPMYYPHYDLLSITFTEKAPKGSGIYTAVAYLCPPARKHTGGGGSSTMDPSTPPHKP